MRRPGMQRREPGNPALAALASLTLCAITAEPRKPIGQLLTSG